VVSNWEGVLDCTNFAPISMQKESNAITNTLVDIYAEKSWHPDYNSYPTQYMSEDSLYLNIWRPNTEEENLPILVYIHGGSLTGGNSNSSDYNGEAMAKKGVIMITVAYRLGVFGYLALDELQNESPNGTTGNYGLLDQIQALKWINENASYFGGDKNNITIAGESAGSSSVSALFVRPLAKALFKRAIGESSSIVGAYPPHTFRSLDDALSTGKSIMKNMGCNSLEELRNVCAEKLVDASYLNSSMTIDGYAITKSPNLVYLNHENNEEALLNGYNVLEADAFVIPTMLLDLPNKNNIKSKLTDYFDEKLALDMMELYKDEIDKDAFSVFNEIISAYWFFMPHYEWSTLAYNNGEDVYCYQFTKENGYYGTYHSGEIIYAYGNISKSKHGFAYNESDYKLSDIMLSYWSNFAKYGNPNGEGLETWDKWDSNKNNLLELGEVIQVIPEKYIGDYQIIDEWDRRTK
jgi:para-nitrobenzyl esterase